MSSDDPRDPIAQQIRSAREKKKAEADASAGERGLVSDFQRQADRDGRGELTKIERLLAARCEKINEAGDAPAFHYDDHSHVLRAGNLALVLDLTEGYSPYFFDMTSGLRPDAAQVFAPGFEPDYEPTRWRFFARTDEDGFFWDCNDERYSNEQIVEEGLRAVATNLGGQ